MKRFISLVILLIILVGVAVLGNNYYKARTTPEPGPTTDSTPGAADPEPISLTVPEGFTISVFSKNFPGVSAMEFGPAGILFVTQTSEGRIIALPNSDGNYIADFEKVIVDGLDQPSGMAFKCDEDMKMCQMFVLENSQLSSFDFDPTMYKANNKRKLIDLPSGGVGTKSLTMLGVPNENTLLISVSASCNVCREENDQRAAVLAYDIEKNTVEKYATGLRSTSAMTLHPVSGVVWGTEMSQTSLTIPDEINIIEKGKFYGWPICYGQNIHNTEFDKNTYIRNPCMSPFETPAKIDLPANTFPRDIAFIPEEGWQEEYWYNALVTSMGQVIRVKLDAQGNLVKGAQSIEPFITGWVRNSDTNKNIGNPVGIKVLPGGTIYISDSTAGRIYVVRRVAE